MDLHNNGYLELHGVDGKNQKKVERLFRRIFDTEAREFPPPGEHREFGLYPNGESWQLEIEDAYGDIDYKIQRFATGLSKLGVRLEGDYKWYGEYDGFSRMVDGRLVSEDIEFYSLRCGDDTMLISELVNRGYRVTRNRKFKKEKS